MESEASPLRGQWGPQPWDGRKSYIMLFLEGMQMLFTGSKNIDPIAGCIAFSKSQNTYNYLVAALFTCDYLKILYFDNKNLSPPTVL